MSTHIFYLFDLKGLKSKIFAGISFLKVSEAATGGVLWDKVFLEISQNSQKTTCARAFFLIKLQAEACIFIKKETLAQVFSCELWEISKNTFSHRTSPGDWFVNFSFNYKQNRLIFYCEGNALYIFLKTPEILDRVTLQKSSELLLLKIPQQAKTCSNSTRKRHYNCFY